MRTVSLIVAAMLAMGTASAHAQSPATGPYAAFDTGFTVGSGVGGLFGGEVGVRLNTWDAFFEGGRMLNTKTGMALNFHPSECREFKPAARNIVAIDRIEGMQAFGLTLAVLRPARVQGIGR